VVVVRGKFPTSCKKAERIVRAEECPGKNVQIPKEQLVHQLSTAQAWIDLAFSTSGVTKRLFRVSYMRGTLS